MQHLKSVTLSIVLVGLFGCGGLGGDGGGADNLPNRGIVPYPAVEDDGDPPAPLLVLSAEEETGTFVGSPAALVTGDRVSVFYALRHVDGTTSSILRADSQDLGRTFGTPTTVVDGSAESRFGGLVAAPAIMQDGPRQVMAFEFGLGAGIAVATSTDGQQFTVESEPALLAEAGETVGSPSLVVSNGQYELFYTVTPDGDDPISSIARATSADITGFVPAGIALPAGTDCEDFDGEPELCWDAKGVLEPDVRIAETVNGRRVYRMFYSGGSDNIGFAASSDGKTWSRYLYNPVVGGGATSPSNIFVSDEYRLFFALAGRDGTGIALGINREGVPSEFF